MLSAVLKAFIAFFTGKFRVYLIAALFIAALVYLASCSYGLQGQRFSAPPQVLVIECDDKALVV